MRTLRLVGVAWLSALLAVSAAAGQETPVNTSDPTYPAAYERYLNDPLRTTPWAGDDLGTDLYWVCPQLPTAGEPRIRLRVNLDRGVANVRYNAGLSFNYCDLVGTITEDATLQVRRGKAGRWRKLGSRIRHTDGLREVLVFYGMPRKYWRVRAAFTDLGDLCAGHHRKVYVRVRLKQRFKGKEQTFQHKQGTNNESPIMESGSAVYRSPPRRICA